MAALLKVTVSGPLPDCTRRLRYAEPLMFVIWVVAPAGKRPTSTATPSKRSAGRDRDSRAGHRRSDPVELERVDAGRKRRGRCILVGARSAAEVAGREADHGSADREASGSGFVVGRRPKGDDGRVPVVVQRVRGGVADGGVRVQCRSTPKVPVAVVMSCRFTVMLLDVTVPSAPLSSEDSMFTSSVPLIRFRPLNCAPLTIVVICSRSRPMSVWIFARSTFSSCAATILPLMSVRAFVIASEAFRATATELSPATGST